jgi:hypothetical protein
MSKHVLKFIFIFTIIVFLASGCSINSLINQNNKTAPIRTAAGKNFIKEPTPAEKDRIVSPVVGNDRDAHGCIGSAGYSWCELKNKCLRIWEEPCLLDNETKAVKDYITKNITALSKQKAVLGGKFYVTNIRILKSGEATVDYEDGHIALQGTAAYQYKNGQVIIEKFIITNDNGLTTGKNQGSGSGQTVCTQEAKQCPDGSYVGRTGPNCEFAPCPGK